MNRGIKSAVIFFMCCMLFNCIQEIEVFKGSNPTLVVDGIVTNEPGPQKIKLSVSTTYNTVPYYGKVEGAVVKIVDDLGNEESLTYSGSGMYMSSADFSGVIGRSYQVSIILKTGEEYASKPEKLVAVPEIQKIRHVQNGTQVAYYIDFTDNIEVRNYYRWRYRGTYEVIAPIAYDLSINPGPLPPSFCFSGGTRPSVSKVWQCWVSEYDNEYLKIENDLLFDGRMMENFPIVAMDLSRKFDIGYTLEIQQLSLTREAYQYWNALQEQIGNNGTIFETANYQIRGNIFSVTNQEELVLGYFGASAVSEATTFVNDFKGTFGPLECTINNAGCYPERCLDCLKYAPSSTNVKPSFWPN